jgi:hypothetical protein
MRLHIPGCGQDVFNLISQKTQIFLSVGRKIRLKFRALVLSVLLTSSDFLKQ